MLSADMQQLIARIEKRIRSAKKSCRRKKAKVTKPVEKLPESPAAEIAPPAIVAPVADYSKDHQDPKTVLSCEYLPKDKSDSGDPDAPVPAKRSTAARPGTPEKIEVLRRRFEANEELWHPLDALDLDKVTRTNQKRELL
jgi:hypothetical protein